MKAVDTVLFEITPEELKEVSSGVQVLRYDTLGGNYSIFVTPKKPEVNKTHERYIHYFLFDKDEAWQGFTRALR